MFANIVEKVREKAKLYPDNVYTAPEDGETNHSLGTPYCSYFNGDNSACEAKGCIFGQVLTELGCEFEDSGDIFTVLYKLYGDPQTELEKSMVAWCGCVQRQQDKQKTWSEAVKFADSYYDFSEKHNDNK